MSKVNIYHRSEILKHNKIDDCWIIVKNNVYDITSFIKHHPGGKDILLSRAGEDATSYFITKHGLNEKVVKMLDKYLIGSLPFEECILVDDLMEEPFLNELLLVLNERGMYRVKKEDSYFFGFIRSIFLLIFFTLSIFVIYFDFHFVFSFFAILVQSFIGISLFGLIAHECTHRNFPKNKFLKKALEFIWPILWPFISKNPLIYEHNSHHIKIGDKEYDYEVAAFSNFIRYSSDVKTKWIHQYQHNLAYLFYPFYANIITSIGGIKSLFWSNHNRSVTLYHLGSIVITSLYYLIIPSIIMGFSFKFICIYLLYQCVLFFGIYVGAAINHFVPQVLEPISEGYKNKYAYYICRNTSNFCSKSKFWFWFTGGFNVQIEHHLVPFIPVENLRSLIPIVKELCLKHNYPYYEFIDFKSLWNAHYSYLHTMASNDNTKDEVLNKNSYQAR